MISWLSLFIEKKPFALGILVSSLLMISVVSWFKIPIEIMPRENTPAFVYIRINVKEEMNPEQLEIVLGRKVENSLRMIPNVMRTSSSLDRKGGSFSLYLEPGTDVDYTILLLQEVLQDLEMKQVLEMQNVSFSKLNPEAQEILKIAIEADPLSGENFKNLIDELRSVIESWAEVSKVDVLGLQPELYKLKLGLPDLSNLRITPPQILRMMENREVKENVGQVRIADSNTKLSITSSIEAENLEQILNRPISMKQPISIKQIQLPMRYDQSKEEWKHKNGKPVVFFEIFTRENADLFEFHRKFKDLAKQYEQKNVVIDTILDRVASIQDALSEVFSSLYQALLITFGIVFLFYRDVRRTLIVCFSIPVTLAFTVGIMFIYGQSLNILSLSGLILGIGMVVDNAILVIDRTDELHPLYGRFKSAGKAAQDVFQPLLLSTLTNAIIFLPVAFVEGGDSFTDLIKALQVPILSSLVASLVIALFVIPFCVILWPPRRSTREESDHSSLSLVSAFRWIQKKQVTLSFGVAMASLVAFHLVSDLDSSDIESPPDPFVKMIVRFGSEVTLDEKKSHFQSIDKLILSAMPNLNYQFVVSDFVPTQANGSWTFYFKSDADMEKELFALKERISEFISNLPVKAGSHLSIGWDSWGGGKSKTFRTIEISGPETLFIIKIQNDLKASLEKVIGVQEVTVEKDERGQREIRYLPRTSQLATRDIQSRNLASHFGGVLSSVNLSFPKNQELNIQFNPRKGIAWDVDQLEQLILQLPTGVSVSGKDLGKFETKNVSRQISRTDGVGKQKLFIYFDEEKSRETIFEAQNQVSQILANFDFPAGYGLAKNDSAARIEEMRKKSYFILLLSAFLIYLILASIFESVLIPIGMMLTVPLALLFGCFGLYLFSFDLDVMARLALVILVGTCVNNAIIIIDLIRNLQKGGIPRKEAIIQGCAKRFKAVMLTTMIQVVSVLPVAFGQSKIMGIPYSTLGIVIIFGIVFSTFVTLVVLPLVYQALDTWEAPGEF